MAMTLQRSWRRRRRTGAIALALCLWLGHQASATALTGRSDDGAAVDLPSLRGQVVMLFFWSTACPVCLDKLPELRRNLAGWTGQPFVVVAVNHDAERADYDRHARLRQQFLPPNPQWIDLWRGAPGHRDDLGPLPTQAPVTVLLDRQGRVRLRVVGRIAPYLWDEVAALVLN
ncbi:peroxiredoxin family protein [Rubrivivax albus]|uniref:TlpA family protein disulfide reductase n=1 Tax=Rubrivivax albus TaxID=2499835 RepID=A0A437JUM1_9BURK|nr:TlpA disulfide reductase family protein [Rubrivivax albus]RVT50933.1 TlpA family protein disulfide reductase [Rubrivivax albus]